MKCLFTQTHFNPSLARQFTSNTLQNSPLHNDFRSQCDSSGSIPGYSYCCVILGRPPSSNRDRYGVWGTPQFYWSFSIRILTRFSEVIL